VATFSSSARATKQISAWIFCKFDICCCCWIWIVEIWVLFQKWNRASYRAIIEDCFPAQSTCISRLLKIVVICNHRGSGQAKVTFADSVSAWKPNTILNLSIPIWLLLIASFSVVLFFITNERWTALDVDFDYSERFSMNYLVMAVAPQFDSDSELIDDGGWLKAVAYASYPGSSQCMRRGWSSKAYETYTWEKLEFKSYV